MVPGTQIERGKSILTVYYTFFDEKVNFQVKNPGEEQAVGYIYFSGMVNDIETFGRGQTFNVKLIGNPVGGFEYWVRAGAGNYDIEIPSASVMSRLSGTDKGMILGTGFRAHLFPDTIVSPAVTLEAGVDYKTFDLDRLQQENSAPVAIAKRLEFVTLQVAALVSKEFSAVTPYGGLKVVRTSATLIDKQNLGKASGVKDNAGLVAGVKFKVHSQEAVVLESNVGLGETNVSVGWSLAF